MHASATMQRIKQIKHWKRKLLLTFSFGVIVLGCYLCHIPCPVFGLLRVPCPGCGMTRAWLCALRLDFAGAFEFHPLFWTIPIGYLFFLFDGHLFHHHWLNVVVLIALALGFGIIYILRMCFLPGFFFG